MREYTASAIIFEQQVEQWIYKALADGAVSFTDFVMALPSVDPAEVLTTTMRLAQIGSIPIKVADRVVADAYQHECFCHKSDILRHEGLPIPHPLDYEWRFASDALSAVIAELMRRSAPGDTITLLGVPSILDVVRREGALPNRYVRLLDINQNMIRHFDKVDDRPVQEDRTETLECNIGFSDLPTLHSSFTVLDPPWYSDAMLAFLKVAAEITILGGCVLVSVPPIGTRPGIKQEIEDLVQAAEVMGFHLEESQAIALPYVSPFFEWNALRTQGITAYPRFWRRGDLMIFSLQSRIPLPLVNPMPPDLWWEVELRGVRFRGRENGITNESTKTIEIPTLVSVVDGDILDAVSRRDKRRNLADVWTSGNRIFGCKNPNVVRIVLSAMKSHNKPLKYVEDALKRHLNKDECALIEAVSAQLDQIVTREQNEMASYAR